MAHGGGDILVAVLLGGLMGAVVMREFDASREVTARGHLDPRPIYLVPPSAPCFSRPPDLLRANDLTPCIPEVPTDSTLAKI